MTHTAQIGPASPERCLDLLWLVFGHLPSDERAEHVETVLEAARAGTLRPGALLAARRGERVVGGIFLELQPGKAALLWPPRLVPEEPAATARQLLARGTEFLTKERVHVAYALLRGSAEEDAALLCHVGFEPLAELLYAVSVKDDFPVEAPSTTLEFEPYATSDRGRLIRVVEATYESTLDCPGLNDVRQTADVLAGYRAIGVFEARRWRIVRNGGRDVGCLLLTDHPNLGSWELIYMGLVPSARGNRWGKDIARYAQWLTGRAGRDRLMLAVDAANGPAVRMYESVGFRRFDRRNAYLKVINTADGAERS
ncbi:MAG: GNAT family N-acetyltransferase [Planctomycetota bacterium]|jgi:ribosomal protein S18 acetylase RimI-like enzyme